MSVIVARDVPLSESDGLTVRRTLPTRERSFVGAWCFVDHFGPNPVDPQHGMFVRPHPHTGLQTVSWLFAGEIEHRDSAGNHALIKRGELNLMTAGRGISHSEMSTTNATTLHGVQLWVVLPEAARFTEPTFVHFVPEPKINNGVTSRVFLGSLLGQSSPVQTFTPLVGAQLDLEPGVRLRLPLDIAFEYGLLLDEGELLVDGELLNRHALAIRTTGTSSVELESRTAVRLLVLGGTPFEEQIVMWWNYIGSSHDEVEQFHRQWLAEVDGTAQRSQFGWPIGDGQLAEVAPPFPALRLKPRGNAPTQPV